VPDWTWILERQNSLASWYWCTGYPPLFAPYFSTFSVSLCLLLLLSFDPIFYAPAVEKPEIRVSSLSASQKLTLEKESGGKSARFLAFSFIVCFAEGSEQQK
jgi:hypothetical protein